MSQQTYSNILYTVHMYTIFANFHVTFCSSNCWLQSCVKAFLENPRCICCINKPQWQACFVEETGIGRIHYLCQPIQLWKFASLQHMNLHMLLWNIVIVICVKWCGPFLSTSRKQKLDHKWSHCFEGWNSLGFSTVSSGSMPHKSCMVLWQAIDSISMKHHEFNVRFLYKNPWISDIVFL